MKHLTILLVAAALLCFGFYSCEKNLPTPNPSREGNLTFSEKGKPVGQASCGIVVDNKDTTGARNLNPWDAFDAALQCGTIPVNGEHSVGASLGYSDTWKGVFVYLATCSTVILDVQFYDNKNNLTDPSDQHGMAWDELGNVVSYSSCCPTVLTGLVPGGIYKIGVTASPCNLRQCSADGLNITTGC